MATKSAIRIGELLEILDSKRLNSEYRIQVPLASFHALLCRWLEDPDSEETRQFVQEQNLLTDSLLEKCETREKYKAMMTKVRAQASATNV